MTSANVDLVRRVFDEYARGSFAAAAEFTHPNFEMRLQASHPIAGNFRAPARRDEGDGGLDGIV
jgi:ketosteroid isomerase-like protein